MTLNGLAEGILVSLYGQTSQTDSSAALVAPMSATDLTFKVDDPQDISSGFVEIDLELLRVVSVDMSTSVVTVSPTGRGRRGTVAAAHSAGAEVRVQPIVPYSSVIRDIQAELSTIYPRISATCYAEFQATPATFIYELPGDVGLVLDVRWKDQLGQWQRVRQWEVEHGQNTTDVSSGIALRITLGVSAQIRVIYGRPFGRLTSLSDLLSDAGIPESLEDVIRTGVLCRILPTLDIARLSVTSTAGSDANNRPPTPGTGVMVARELRAAYRERLDQEIKTFRSYFPVVLHKTR
jgi:hypothetical protein